MAYANGCGMCDKLSPILYNTLVHLDLMLHREFTTPEELKAALRGGDRLLIDATERAYHRSQDEAKQREHYSGKKRHTLKNTVMALPDKFIIFLVAHSAGTITTTSC